MWGEWTPGVGGLARIAADRDDADYGAVTTFEAHDAAEDLAHAAEFVAAIEGYPGERGEPPAKGSASPSDR